MAQLRSIADILAGHLPQAAQQRAAAWARHDSEHVTIYSETARKLIALGYGPELRVWLALAHLNRLAGGPGWLALADLPGKLAALTGGSPITIRQLLIRRAGLAWALKGAGVGLVSSVTLATRAATLAAAAGIASPQARDQRHDAPLDWLAGPLALFQARIMALWLGKYGVGGARLTWASLAALWRHSRGQLRRWIAAAQIGSSPSFGAYPIATGDQAPETIDFDPALAGLDHGWLKTWKGHTYLNWQRCNTLWGSDKRTPGPGRAIKINRALKSLTAGQYGGQVSTSEGSSLPPAHDPRIAGRAGDGSTLRRNFERLPRLDRYRKRHPDRAAYCHVHTSRKKRSGARWLVWHLYAARADAFPR